MTVCLIAEVLCVLYIYGIVRRFEWLMIVIVKHSLTFNCMRACVECICFVPFFGLVYVNASLDRLCLCLLTIFSFASLFHCFYLLK